MFCVLVANHDNGEPFFQYFWVCFTVSSETVPFGQLYPVAFPFWSPWCWASLWNKQNNWKSKPHSTYFCKAPWGSARFSSPFGPSNLSRWRSVSCLSRYSTCFVSCTGDNFSLEASAWNRKEFFFSFFWYRVCPFRHTRRCSQSFCWLCHWNMFVLIDMWRDVRATRSEQCSRRVWALQSLLWQ